MVCSALIECWLLGSTYYYIAKDYVVDGPVPIGQAISKTDLYVVADGLPWREVNCGEEGELLIGGIGVAAGYLNAPDLTKERFIGKHPCAQFANISSLILFLQLIPSAMVLFIVREMSSSNFRTKIMCSCEGLTIKSKSTAFGKN